MSVLQSLRALWGKAHEVTLSDVALVELRRELIELSPEWSRMPSPVGDPDYQGTIFRYQGYAEMSIEVVDRTSDFAVAKEIMNTLEDQPVINALSLLSGLLIHISKTAGIRKEDFLAVLDGSWGGYEGK